LESTGELTRVAAEVDPDQEIAAICRRVVRAGGGTALWFERVRGSAMPVVANVWGTRKRYAMMLGVSESNLYETWTERVGRGGLPTERAGRAACQAVVVTGGEIDLGTLPVPTWNANDAGPYLTSAVCLSRDPETGARNSGIYRMLMLGKDRMSLCVNPARPIMKYRPKYRKQGRRTPAAIVIGGDPVFSAAAAAPFPDGVDELEMAGALRGEPLEMAPAKTIDLDVPATAEIVLEGELTDETVSDGPFGEFHGYYGRPMDVPVFEVTAITHRSDALFQGVDLGVPPTEYQVFGNLPFEFEVRRQVGLPDVITGLALVDGGCRFVAVVRIRKQLGGQGKAVGAGVLSSPKSEAIRTVIVVDDDIDISDPQAVYWALGTRFDPARGVEILHDMPGNRLDPLMADDERSSKQFRVSKMIIDATRPVGAGEPEACVPSAQVQKLIESRWSEYGITMPSGLPAITR
jgi:UbiD family decarboxylase